MGKLLILGSIKLKSWINMLLDSINIQVIFLYLYYFYQIHVIFHHPNGRNILLFQSIFNMAPILCDSARSPNYAFGCLHRPMTYPRIYFCRDTKKLYCMNKYLYAEYGVYGLLHRQSPWVSTRFCENSSFQRHFYSINHKKTID